MQKREDPKEIAKGHELAWLRLRSDSMPFLTRFFPKPLFPFLHEDFSLLLLGRAGGQRAIWAIPRYSDENLIVGSDSVGKK